MTLKERIIVEVYTGICMTYGNERKEVHKYMEKLLGRPIWTHELAEKTVQEELIEKSKADFKRLCEPKPHTKADRIRSMSDDELAKFLCRLSGCRNCIAQQYCRAGINGFKEWLKKEVEDE